MLSDKIKNADRVHRANNLIVQAVEHENNSEIISALLEVSQMISDIHKACVADLKYAKRSE